MVEVGIMNEIPDEIAHVIVEGIPALLGIEVIPVVGPLEKGL